MFGSKFFANVSVCKEWRGLKAVNFAIRKFFQIVKGFVYRITPAFICTLVSNRFSRSSDADFKRISDNPKKLKFNFVPVSVGQ